MLAVVVDSKNIFTVVPTQNTQTHYGLNAKLLNVTARYDCIWKGKK
jgi:hypothetical protein